MKRLPILQLILLWLLSCSQLALADRITYFHYDATGTAIMATDEQANVLWKRAPTAYGETPEFHPAMKKYNHRMTVAGHYDDWETGLIYMGKRYYSPKLGRFLTPDPVGVYPHLPQSFNRYGYANNNPYKFVDPNGQIAKLAKMVWNVGKRTHDTGSFKKGMADEINNLWGNAQELFDGDLTPDDAFAVIDLLTGFGGEARSVANSGLKRAEALRDAELEKISKLSKTQQSKITTVVGAHDPATGRVSVGVKKTCAANAGKCAEDLASEALGNPENIEFTPVIRPRHQKIIPRCDRCVIKYGPEN